MPSHLLLSAFMFGQHFARAVDDLSGKSGEFGDFNAIAAVRRALCDFA